MKYPVPAVLALLTACTAGAPPDITAAEREALADPPPAIRAEVAERLPETLAMLDRAEAAALTAGRPLTAAETATARALGVAHPERVRILTEARRPGEIFAALLGRGMVGGLTTGYGITVKPGFDADWLIAHELVHVQQFEAAGRAEMVRRYLTETLILPGNLIPIEREAIERAEAVAGPGGRYAY
ncbi:MAG: hypothetical protein KDK11_07420 [Maritimibacter sp.]|nr:hypothetical protein [Maritimibacter sp.]